MNTHFGIQVHSLSRSGMVAAVPVEMGVWNSPSKSKLGSVASAGTVLRLPGAEVDGSGELLRSRMAGSSRAAVVAVGIGIGGRLGGGGDGRAGGRCVAAVGRAGGVALRAGCLVTVEEKAEFLCYQRYYDTNVFMILIYQLKMSY